MGDYLDSLIRNLACLESQLIVSEICPGQIIKIHLKKSQSSFIMIVRYVVNEDLSITSNSTTPPTNAEEPGIYASMGNYDTARDRYTYVKAQSGYFDVVTTRKNPEVIELLPLDSYGVGWVASFVGRINLNHINTLDLLKI